MYTACCALTAQGSLGSVAGPRSQTLAAALIVSTGDDGVQLHCPDTMREVCRVPLTALFPLAARFLLKALLPLKALFIKALFLRAPCLFFDERSLAVT